MNAPDVPIFDGEAFSCWVYRQSLCSQHTLLDRSSLAELWHACVQSEDFDPDFTQDSKFSRAACEMLDIPREEQAKIFQPNSRWVIPRYFRRSFCYSCMKEHIANFSLPSYRKEWCSVGVVVCQIHKCSLLDASGIVASSPSMAMRILKAYSEDPSQCVAASRSHDANEQFTALYKTQLFFQALEASQQQADQNGMWSCSEPHTGLPRLLLSIFLYPRFGLVNRFIAPRSSYRITTLFQQTLNAGPLVAGIAQRWAGMLMLGWLFELFTPRESTDVESFIERAGAIAGFHDARSLGAACNVFNSLHSDVIARRLREWMPNPSPALLQQFIEGFSEVSIRS